MWTSWPRATNASAIDLILNARPLPMWKILSLRFMRIPSGNRRGRSGGTRAGRSRVFASDFHERPVEQGASRNDRRQIAEGAATIAPRERGPSGRGEMFGERMPVNGGPDAAGAAGVLARSLDHIEGAPRCDQLVVRQAPVAPPVLDERLLDVPTAIAPPSAATARSPRTPPTLTEQARLEQASGQAP